MEHYDKEKLSFAVNETKAMLDWLNEKRDRFRELSEYWKSYGDTVGYTDDSDEMVTGTVEFLEDIYTEQYEDFDDMTRYWSHFVNRFENLVNEIGKKDEKYKDLLTVSFLLVIHMSTRSYISNTTVWYLSVNVKNMQIFTK